MSVVEVVRFFVAGTPIPQGSKKAFVVGKRAVIVDANKDALKPWRAAVTKAAAAARTSVAIRDEPLVVVVTFQFVRPPSVRRERPHVKPDTDKLLRSVLDSLTDAAVWGDDGQVVKAVAEKVYAAEAGVHVRVGKYINEKGSVE